MSELSLSSQPSQLSFFSQPSQMDDSASASIEMMDDSDLSPSPRQVRGWINDHFDTIIRDGKRYRYCKADGCSQRYAASGSTNLFKEHWRRDHSINSTAKKPYFLFHDTLHANRFIKCVISLHLNYSIVDKPEFKAFVEALNANKSLMCRKTLSNTINNSKLRLTELICDRLKQAKSVALTFDIWSAHKGARGFGCVTAHFISSCGLENIILHFKRMKFPHDADVVLKFITKPINTFQLQGKVVSITTDNASNNVAAIRSIDSSYALTSLNLGFIHYKCVAHIIDLGMRDAMKRLKETLMPVREAVMAVRCSRKRKEKFFDKQDELISDGEQLTKQPLELAEDVDHRWNSAYVLLERAYLLRDALDYMLETTPGLDQIGPIDWLIVQKIIAFLKPFFDATKRLCSGSDVTISAVGYILPRLIDHCAAHENDANNWTKDAACSLRSKLTDYQLELYHPVVDIAYFLDPRYKTKNLTIQHRENVINRVRELMDDIPLLEGDSRRSSYNSIIGSDSDIDEQINELEAYCDQKRERMDTNVLDWWRLNAAKFPKLYDLAFKVLPIQATSVASERIFSIAGDVDTKSRNRLSDDSVESIIILKSWMQFLNIE